MAEFKRREPAIRGSELDLLNGFLDYQRDTLEWKYSGLTAEQMKSANSPPSPMTLLGLVRHMTVVEYFWFENMLLDRKAHASIYEEDSPEGEWTDLDSHTPEEVLQRWKDACGVSRKNVASATGPDSLSARQWNEGQFMLRWIMIHMIEEYARHNGHADLIREKIDGETGE